MLRQSGPQGANQEGAHSQGQLLHPRPRGHTTSPYFKPGKIRNRLGLHTHTQEIHCNCSRGALWINKSSHFNIKNVHIQISILRCNSGTLLQRGSKAGFSHWFTCCSRAVHVLHSLTLSLQVTNTFEKQDFRMTRTDAHGRRKEETAGPHRSHFIPVLGKKKRLLPHFPSLCDDVTQQLFRLC